MSNENNSQKEKGLKLPQINISPKVILTNQQKEVILANLQSPQSIIHYIFWSYAKYNGRDNNLFLSVLTGSAIIIFIGANQKDHEKGKIMQKYNFNIKFFGRIDLLDLTAIGFDDSDNSSMIHAPITNNKSKNEVEIRYKSDEFKNNLFFVQCVYRNYYINYVNFPKKEIIKIYGHDADKYFPKIDIHFSPSQKFQYQYYLNCIQNGVEYNHRIVQHIHSLLLFCIPIVDISMLCPIKQDSSSYQGKYLNTILQSLFILFEQKLFSGICCIDIKCPDLIYELKYLIEKVNFIHLENCDMTLGIKQLYKIIKKHKSKVSYWCLRRNCFEDINFFIDILNYTKTNLIYLDLSYCNLTEEFMKKLYKELVKYPTLQQLHVAGSRNSKEVAEEFDKLLTAYKSSGKIELHTLDLSDINDIFLYLDVLNKHKIQLRSLKVANVNIKKVDIESNLWKLQDLIYNSNKLKSLDLSGFEYKSPYIENFQRILSRNEKLLNFDLYLNSLRNLKIVPFISSMITGPTHEMKWNHISLDSNNLTQFDLQNNIPLFKIMNIRSLSINNVFKEDMENIDTIICSLIEDLDSLKKLSISGGSKCKLGLKLNPILNAIAQSNIEEIDFSNNGANKDFYQILMKVINTKNNGDSDYLPLSSISIDGNGLQSFQMLDDIYQLIEKNSITKFDFPIKDCKELIQKVKNDDTVYDFICNARNKIFNAVNINRIKLKMFPILPINTTKEINKLILKMTEQMRNKIKDQNPFQHTKILQEFGLPLPYLEMNNYEQDGGSEITNPKIKNLETIYHSSMISKSIIEKPKYQLITENNFSEKEENNNDYVLTSILFNFFVTILNYILIFTII